jgi:catechol 2,3-dioxygenase-like lactoylglutathione lyase family enzyme
MRWDHAGIKSRDVKKSLEFYTGALGWRQLEVITIFDKNFYFVGNDSIRLEIEEANATDTRAEMGAMSGLYHMALAVDDLDGLAGRLDAHGAKFILRPSQFRPDRKIAFVEDPDGVFIQLIQYL